MTERQLTRRAAEPVRGELQYLPPGIGGGALDCHSGHRGGAADMGTVVERRVVGVDRPIAYPLERQAEGLRRNPAKRSRGALADLDRRGIDDHPPGRKYLDQGLGMIGAAAILDPDREAHALPLRAVDRPGSAPSVTQAIDDHVETGKQIALDPAVAGLERFALREQVFAAELVWVDPKPPRDHVDLRFRGKARLGSAKPAEGSGRHRIGAHRASAGRDRLPAIRAGNAITGLDHGHRTRIGIGAAIELNFALPRCQPTVCHYTGFQHQYSGVFGQRQETLVEAEAQPYRAPR